MCPNSFSPLLRDHETRVFPATSIIASKDESILLVVTDVFNVCGPSTKQANCDTRLTSSFCKSTENSSVHLKDCSCVFKMLAMGFETESLALA